MSSSNRVLEAPAEIVARRAELQVSSLTGELVAELERFLADLPGRYETAGPLILAPELVDARRLVQQLLARNQRLKQRSRLFELAGQLSGQLSYMAVNLGNFSVAQAYGAEAFELARFIGHDELSAWIRGTQSLAAYYTGNHQRALDLAQDGQCYAKGGLQAVRLAVNGEARALGKLHDQRGAAVAVTSAYRVLERFPPAGGMTPCISFGIYSEARTASNAATAYLALGQTNAGGDRDLASYALVRRALMALYRNDAAETIELSRCAQQGTVLPRIRGLAAQREAQGHALAGDRDACLRCLDSARGLLALSPSDPAAPVLGPTNLTDPVAMITGWCLYDLGRPGEAAEILDREITLVPPNALRSRIRYGVRRALAHSGAGEVEHACEIAEPLLGGVGLVGSATIRTDVRRLARTLSRFRATRSVRELSPQLAAALQGPAT